MVLSGGVDLSVNSALRVGTRVVAVDAPYARMSAAGVSGVIACHGLLQDTSYRDAVHLLENYPDTPDVDDM